MSYIRPESFYRLHHFKGPRQLLMRCSTSYVPVVLYIMIVHK